MATFSDAYKEALYQIEESTQSNSPYGVLTKEVERGAISWTNDALTFITLVPLGIDDSLTDNLYQGDIVDYDSNYAKVFNPAPLPQLYPNYDIRGNKVTIVGSEVHKETAPGSGIYLYTLDPTDPNYNVPQPFPTAGVTPNPVNVIPVFEIEDVDDVQPYLVRPINTSEQNWILSTDETYERTLIAYFLYNLVSLNDNKEFEEKFFGENHNFYNYGYELFKKDNGARFMNAYRALVADIGNLRNIQTTKTTLAPQTIHAVTLDWTVRLNVADNKPYLDLIINYSDHQVYPVGLYENAFWSFLHRQMFFLLQSAYAGLVAGEVTVQANTLSLIQDSPAREFAQRHYLQVFDILDYVVPDELVLIDLNEISNKRGIPYFTNFEAMQYLYRIFKKKTFSELTNFGDYYEAMFQNI